MLEQNQLRVDQHIGLRSDKLCRCFTGKEKLASLLIPVFPALSDQSDAESWLAFSFERFCITGLNVLLVSDDGWNVITISYNYKIVFAVSLGCISHGSLR